jgi:predicted PurR-regulated permease PerM
MFKKILILFLVVVFFAPRTLHAAQTTTLQGSDQKQFNIMTAAGDWFANNSLVKWVNRTIPRFAITIKNALESLVDRVFKMLCSSLLKLWNFTIASGDTGVGADTANYINTSVMPFLFTLAGSLLYLFVVLKFFTGLLLNENPTKTIGYFVIVIFLVISYGLFYNITIELFSRILSYANAPTSTVTTSELSQNLAATLTGDKDTVAKIAGNVTDDDLDAILKTPNGATTIWVSVLTEILTAGMFVYFIVQVLLLKGQQLVQLFLSFFLGILILPITILSGVDLFVRWIKSFIGTCLYSFVWALLIMLIYAVSKIQLGGLSAAAALPSVLKLIMYFGVFMLMTQVGKVSEFFTGGDNFGKIAQAGAREFGACLRTAGQVAALPVTAPLAGAAAGATAIGFGAGVFDGYLNKGTKTPGAGSPGGGSRGGRGPQGAGFMSLPGISHFTAGMTSGQAFGSQAGSAFDLSAKSIAAIRNFGNKDYGSNDGTKTPTVTSFNQTA